MYKFKRTIVYVPYHSSVRLGRQFEDAFFLKKKTHSFPLPNNSSYLLRKLIKSLS